MEERGVHEPGDQGAGDPDEHGLEDRHRVAPGKREARKRSHDQAYDAQRDDVGDQVALLCKGVRWRLPGAIWSATRMQRRARSAAPGSSSCIAWLAAEASA